MAFEVAGSVEGGATLCALVPDQCGSSPLCVDQFVSCEGTIPAKHRITVRAHVGAATCMTLAIGNKERNTYCKQTLAIGHTENTFFSFFKSNSYCWQKEKNIYYKD